MVKLVKSYFFENLLGKEITKLPSLSHVRYRQNPSKLCRIPPKFVISPTRNFYCETFPKFAEALVPVWTTNSGTNWKD